MEKGRWIFIVILLIVAYSCNQNKETKTVIEQSIDSQWKNPNESYKNMKLLNPGYLETVYDSTYNLNITKISDSVVFKMTGSRIQHQYSKVQAWNSDMTYVLLGARNLLDVKKGYKLIKTLSNHMIDGRWSNIQPNIRYFGDGEFLKKIDVETEEITILHKFPDYATSKDGCTIGPWEGNLSADDRYVVVTSWDEKHASVYDIKNETVLGEKYFPESFDWASVTPWGDCIVVNERGTGGEFGNGVTNIYDLNFKFIKQLSDKRAHADFAIDTKGNRVFVEMCPITMINIETGEKTDLLPSTDLTKGTCCKEEDNPWICGHASGRNFNLPGWVFISAGIDQCPDSTCGFYHKTEMFLLKLDGSGTIRSYGFSRSSYGLVPEYTDSERYLAEAKAVISPDGTKAIFTSDWFFGGKLGEMVDYVVEIK